MTNRPNLFLIGAPKSGTTSLYEYLNGHPDIYMSPHKEPFYFSPDIRGGPRENYRYPEDEDKYLALFADATSEKWLGEASTRYVYSRRAPELVKAFSPDARIVAMFRNPIDMMYAMHNERVAQGEETVPDFEAALALDDERLAGRSLPPGSNELGATYRPRAHFGEQLQRWLETFERDRVHVIVFEEFALDTPGAFKTLLEFLGVDPDYRPADFAVHNPSHRPRGGITRRFVASPAGQALAHRVMPAVLGQNRTNALVRRYRHSRLNRQPNPRPTLAPELRAKLAAELTPDVELLGSLLGRDMKSFSFGQ